MHSSGTARAGPPSGSGSRPDERPGAPGEVAVRGVADHSGAHEDRRVGCDRTGGQWFGCASGIGGIRGHPRVALEISGHGGARQDRAALARQGAPARGRRQPRGVGAGRRGRDRHAVGCRSLHRGRLCERDGGQGRDLDGQRARQGGPRVPAAGSAAGIRRRICAGSGSEVVGLGNVPPRTCEGTR